MILSDEEVFAMLREKLDENIPFSLLRYGDGEGIFAFMYPGLGKVYAHASLKHWGEVPRGMFRMEISKHLKNSYRKCDVAGLPYGFKGFYWQTSLNHFLKQMPKPITCNSNIHISLHESGVLNELIHGRKVFYVSCRNVDNTLLQYGAKEVAHLLIPAQYKFTDLKPRIPFYKKANAVESEIRNKNLKGTLCLLAAGVAGKQLGIAMQEQGGIVVDIGSVIDLWAGVKSRGWIKTEEFI
jgi:hypothetical protein